MSYSNKYFYVTKDYLLENRSIYFSEHQLKNKMRTMRRK